MPSRSSSEGSEPAALNERLLILTEDSDYTLTQVNGQRVYRKAPHAWSGPDPSRECEVFVGRIPHDCFEDRLVPLFQEAGELFEFRLMINFSGFNRGYGFAMYTSPEAAHRAIDMFNNYFIRHNWQLGVCQSVNNCRLYISRIPTSITAEQVVRIMYELTDEVQDVRMRRADTGCSSAVVEYKSHRGAAMARKALVAAGQAWGGARPNVDWSPSSTTQFLARYPVVGRWSPERGVEITEVKEAPASWGPHALPPPPSYQLEPWVRARRQRLIEDTCRASAVRWAEFERLCALEREREILRERLRRMEQQRSPSVSDATGSMRALSASPPSPRAAPPSPARAATPPRPASGDWVPEPEPRGAPAAPRAPGDFDPWNSISLHVVRGE